MLRVHPQPRHAGRTLAAAAVAFMSLACADATRSTSPRDATLAPSSSPSASVGNGQVTHVDYDAKDASDYAAKWLNIYGALELAPGKSGTLTVAPNGGVTISAVPFDTGADYSVYDHLKYIGVSAQSFDVPTTGSLEFAVDIDASTPGTVAGGRVIHGCYGAPYSYLFVGAPCARAWTGQAVEGQQAGVVLNMINFATGQLFDWFVSETQVFALIERLPSNVTNALLPPSDPAYVGLDKAYTQIIKVQNVAAGKRHRVAIRYTRGLGVSRVEYFLDGQLFTAVDHVGVPLDKQGVPFTGTYASLGNGEPLGAGLSSFVIGHGLFSLLDAFPFQHPDRPDLSVSVPMSERLFGQGAVGTFSHFQVTTTR